MLESIVPNKKQTLIRNNEEKTFVMMIILETDSSVGYMLALDTPIQIFYMGISFNATHSRP